MPKQKAAKKTAAKRSPTWALKELKAIAELYDHARCTPELRDKLNEQVWRELERGR